MFAKCGVCGETFTVQGMPAHAYLKHGVRQKRYVTKQSTGVRIYVSPEAREMLRALRNNKVRSYSEVIVELVKGGMQRGN